MIRNRTVFVLGAGASVPYGFSTGIELLEKARATTVDGLMGNAADQLTEREKRDFSIALADNMLPSVDAMLEHRQDLWKVGKKVMATLLYAEELAARPPAEHDWMALVFENMAAGAATPEQFGENPVTFVTFNYDRYLEYRLIHGLMALYRIGSGRAWKALKEFGFLHVHGSLGELPTLLDTGVIASPSSTMVPLGAPETEDLYTLGLALQGVDSSIRIVHDAVVGPAYEAARAALAKAEQVFFLGFGFGRENVARLQTSSIPQTVPVHCTAYGMTEAEIIDRIIPAFPAHHRNVIRHGVANSPIRQFLRERILTFR